LLGAQVRHRRFPIADCGVPEPEAMNTILAAVDESLAAGRVVYVHCAGGIGRTGTVVGCWLVRHGLSGSEALERIAALRRGTPSESLRSPGTDGQRRFVLEWR
jgi:protein-tyrosine phosphatase